MSLFGRMLGIEPAASAEISNASDPKSWLTDIFGGMLTASGLRVTPEIALSVPGVSACVNVLSEDLAKVPLTLYKRTRERGKIRGREPAVDHPLYKILRHPNPWTTSFNWRRGMVSACMTRGDAFTRVTRNRRGDVTSLRSVRPGSTTIKWTEDGEPFYDITLNTVEKYTYSWQEVVHFMYRGDLAAGRHGGIRGVSPLARHSETIALAVAAEKFAAAFFKNGARPSAIIEFEGKLPNDEVASRIRGGLERAYAGVDNAFKIAILEMGMKMKPFAFDNSESQLVEVRKEVAVAIAQMFGIPPHKVGILDKATFSNIENQAIDYVTGPVSALAQSFEEALNISCLTGLEQEEYFIAHDLNDLLRGDIASRYKAYAVGRQWGWLSPNEIRRLENQNPIDDPKGDEYLTPANMNTGEQDEDPSNPNGRPPNSAEEIEPSATPVPPRVSSLVSYTGERLLMHESVP